MRADCTLRIKLISQIKRLFTKHNTTERYRTYPPQYTVFGAWVGEPCSLQKKKIWPFSKQLDLALDSAQATLAQRLFWQLRMLCVQTNQTRTGRASAEHHAPCAVVSLMPWLCTKKTPQLVIFNRGRYQFCFVGLIYTRPGFQTRERNLKPNAKLKLWFRKGPMCALSLAQITSGCVYLLHQLMP